MDIVLFGLQTLGLLITPFIAMAFVADLTNNIKSKFLGA